MIRYDEGQKLLTLETENTSYWIGLEKPWPISLYWGEKADPRDRAAISFTEWHGAFDDNVLRERAEFPCWDARTFEHIALQADQPLFMNMQDFDIKGEELSIRLTDETTGHTAVLRYRVYPEYDVIERRVDILAGDETLTLLCAASGTCCLPNTGGQWTAHYTAGAWAGEFRRRMTPLQEADLCLQATRGVSGLHLNPSLMVTDAGSDDAKGRAYAVMLGWSGGWQINASVTSFGNAAITAGFCRRDWRATLNAHEGLSTPPMYLCASGSGIDGLSRKLHDFERKALWPCSRPRRVLYNSWEPTQFNVQVKEQMVLAARAAEIGIELFVVDDGWFGRRSCDSIGLGDWTVNPDKFPNGLMELVDHVQKLGMDFGIWVEPESVNPDSELFRAHPDWIYRLKNHEPLTLRNQYLLDLGKPQVEAFVSETLSGLLRDFKISYFKWDMNRPITDVDGQARPMARERHMDAVYRILERLKRDYPGVDIEACSSGGGRVDLGMVARTDQFWASDNTDPYERLWIQEGCSLGYAPAMTSCWVTDTPVNAHKDGRTDWAYKFHVAMCGSLGVGSDISKLTAVELQTYADMIQAYKRIRHLVFEGDLFRLGTPSRDEAFAVEFCAKDQSEFVLLAFLHSQRYDDRPKRIFAQGLLADGRYGCKETGECFSGSTLMHAGLCLPLQGDFHSCMRHFCLMEQ